MYYPSKKEFIALTQKGNLIPVYREILGDLETPVSTYLKIAAKAKYSCLLESVEGQEKIARYSFLAKDPELVFQSKGRTAEIIQFKNGRIQKNSLKVLDTPLSFIREIMARYKFVEVANLPRFCGGLIGYMGYDLVRYFETIPEKTKDDLHLPDMIFMLFKNMVIFDHMTHKIKIISCAHADSKASNHEKLSAYENALTAVDRIVEELNLATLDQKQIEDTQFQKLQLKSNMTETQFKNSVRKAKERITAGDIIQVVLSQRFETQIQAHPFRIYRELRSVNPSPYMYYLKLDNVALVGSSPELLVRCEDGIVETRPIAGTRKRGKTDKDDASLQKELLSDPKERAEHTMLVDLGRNDLGRVCIQGTVKLSEFMSIEKYSHVMHIVSNVKGKLRPDKDIFDVLQAAFPAGTVSGAPKIRAMEIIEDLEPTKRGPYAGCIGYFSFSGNLDTCITIRTIVIKDEKAYIQAGAGIVADSQPQHEYLETINKAKAQLMAIEMAHQE
ncbi:MAG: anthranilate synthase component I [Candidatus Omnitrophota bacterium]